MRRRFCGLVVLPEKCRASRELACARVFICCCVAVNGVALSRLVAATVAIPVTAVTAAAVEVVLAAGGTMEARSRGPLNKALGTSSGTTAAADGASLDEKNKELTGADPAEGL